MTTTASQSCAARSHPTRNSKSLDVPNTIGRTIDLDNLADRLIKAILKANGWKWKGWLAYRRGLATNLHERRILDKVIQAILRHEARASKVPAHFHFVSTLPNEYA